MNSAAATGDGRRDVPADIPWGWLAAASIVGAILVLAATYRYGIGISPDSAGYLCAARNLLAGRGFWTVCDSPYTAWPPLFPTVLAAIGLAGIDPAVGARLLNAAAMGGIILVSGVFFCRCLRSRLLAAIGICSMVLSFPLLGIASMAWTEPLFVLLIASFVLPMSAFLRARRPLLLVAAAILAALCSLQRYTGVALIGAGIILILWPASNADFRGRLKQCACFTMISSLPLGLWMLRNRWLTGMLSGHPRQHSIYSVWQNVAAAVDTVTRWFMPESMPLTVRACILGTLIVLLGAVLLLRARAGGGPGGCVRTAGLVLSVYLPLILYTHQVGVLDETMNDRYLAPLAVMVPWLIFAAMDELVAWLRLYPHQGSVLASVAVAACGFWLVHPLRYTCALLSDQMHSGAGGYSRTEWRESPLVQWLVSHPPETPLRSNAPAAVYALLGVDARVSPHRTWDLPAFRKTILAGAGETLVWFKASAASYLYELDELVSVLPVEEIISFPDGGVYRLGASAKNASVDDRAFSTYMVDGVRHRRFTSDTYGPRGLIASWVLRTDGTTESVWELDAGDGKVIRWSPSCRYARSGDELEFRCEGQATRTGDASTASYRLHVRGTIHDDSAAGEYQIEFSGAQWPAVDRGRWRIDRARPVYRLYSRRRGTHAYVMGRDEVTAFLRQSEAAWASEGPAFCVYPEGSQPPDVLPVFRFSSRTTGADFYTIGEAEREHILSDSAAWDYRGIAWYAYPPERHPPGVCAVHRFWSGVLSTHFYTAVEAEKDKLLSGPSQSWAYEGIAWYALPAAGH